MDLSPNSFLISLVVVAQGPGLMLVNTFLLQRRTLLVLVRYSEKIALDLRVLCLVRPKMYTCSDINVIIYTTFFAARNFRTYITCQAPTPKITSKEKAVVNRTLELVSSFTSRISASA